MKIPISLLIISFLLITGCSKKNNQNKTKKKPQMQETGIKNQPGRQEDKKDYKDQKTIVKEGKRKESGAIIIVKKYLTLLSNKKLSEANTLVINKEYTFTTSQGDKFSIAPIKENPFSLINVKKIEESKASISDPLVELYTCTIVADIKWPNDNKLYNDTAFFINALKMDGKWMVDGISTEF
jgi:hypothetical protein